MLTTNRISARRAPSSRSRTSGPDGALSFAVSCQSFHVEDRDFEDAEFDGAEFNDDDLAELLGAAAAVVERRGVAVK